MSVFGFFGEEASCEVGERICDCAVPGLGILITATRLAVKGIQAEERRKSDDDDDNDD